MEVLKRGKAWLRTKMVVKTTESHGEQQAAEGASDQGEARSLDSEQGPVEKLRKRQRVESKPTRKVSKKTQGVTQPHASGAALAEHSSISPLKTTEGENISAIVKECLKSFAPLLFNRDSAVLRQERKGGWLDEASLGSGKGAEGQKDRHEQVTSGSPTAAWGQEVGGKWSPHFTRSGS
ncbi:hypothetical protein NDU88_004149 [Pleurodeles waltl]|uniref:Uncharacterized protein n=1 Tax=Pleurodeles waltl TaxID=8319 RepID=A0AAV7T783_PLEWA|nr:hypothetical protein NDU88_004149 [Pleurodeles waltl]